MMENKTKFARSQAIIESCRAGMAERIVGQENLVNGMLMAWIAGGHVLLEGVPGLAKTLAVKTFSSLAGLDFKRIQFTPDLLPADLVGTLIFEQGKGSFSIRKGPVFANLVLADEINRAPAKVQSALLEAMAERQVTIGEETHRLPDPFFVLATQNPIEQEGTYTLPEAELDRFLLKLQVPYPTPEEETAIVLAAPAHEGSPETGSPSAASLSRKPVIGPDDLAVLRADLAAIRCDEAIVSYIVSLVAATRPSQEARKDRRTREDYLKYISFGASPRASIALGRLARVTALFEGRDYVLPADVKAVALPVLRHRLVLSYEAGADGLSADDIIGKILSVVPLP